MDILSNKPGAIDMVIVKGRTFDISLEWRAGNSDVEITVDTPESQLPPLVDLNGAQATFTLQSDDKQSTIIFDLTNGVTIDAQSSLVNLSLAPAATATVAWVKGTYECAVSKDGKITSLVRGRVKFVDALDV